MEFRHVPNEIDRALEPRFIETIENIRNGANPEYELKQFADAIHQQWITKAVEYARGQEEKRKRDREEFECKLHAMEREMTNTRNANSVLRQTHAAHLQAIKIMMNNHLKFSNIQGEKLIDLCGNLCCVLGKLIEHHENVEVAETLQEQVNQEVAKILRQQCVETVNAKEEEITNYLNENLCRTKFPSACGNLVDLDEEILKLKGALFGISSLLNNLTAEYWNQEAVNSIGELKSTLTESTGKVLELLETVEANHKSAVDKKFILQIAH